jgi:hypothetical protein
MSFSRSSQATILFTSLSVQNYNSLVTIYKWKIQFHITYLQTYNDGGDTDDDKIKCTNYVGYLFIITIQFKIQIKGFLHLASKYAKLRLQQWTHQVRPVWIRISRLILPARGRRCNEKKTKKKFSAPSWSNFSCCKSGSGTTRMTRPCPNRKYGFGNYQHLPCRYTWQTEWTGSFFK